MFWQLQDGILDGVLRIGIVLVGQMNLHFEIGKSSRHVHV